MCYTKQASITAFLVGIISSVSLIVFGNEANRLENLGIGILFFIVSFMQLFDYMIWSDLDCKKDYNRIAGIIGPIFNALQPTILYIYMLYTNNSNKNIASVINIIYLIYVVYIYNQHLKGDICSKVEDGRVRWSWYKSWNKLGYNQIYLIIALINILLLVRSKYMIIAVVISFIFLGISKINYKYHVGEFWCYFVNSIPLIILGLQKLKI
jgi:hypothetical protein